MKRLSIIAALALTLHAAAQQRTSIGFVYPAGGQRGTTFEVAVGGQNLQNVRNMVFSGEGITAEKIATPTAKKTAKKEIGEEDNLQLADQIKFRVTIAPGAKPGLRDARLETPNGMSNRLYFEVGTLPDVREQEPNDASGGNRIEKLPATINGQVMRSDADRFTFAARGGEDILLRVQGRVLIPYIADAVPGWFQPTLSLMDAKGQEVAYCDDYKFQVDPVIMFRVPADGDYTMEIRDALHRGREDFTYRIDVGRLPFITDVFPLGARKGGKAEADINGINLPQNKIKLAAAIEGTQPVQVITRDGYYSNALPFERDNFLQKPWKPCLTRTEAMPLKPGEATDAVMEKPMQEHWYTVDIPARGPVMFEVTARRLGSPADMKMVIYDQQGKRLVEVDDVEDTEQPMLTHHADPLTLQRIDKPGRYTVRLQETQGYAGPDYSYRFKVYKPEIDFSLSIEPSSLAIPAGSSAVITVTAVRRNGFNGQLDIGVEGLPEGFIASYGTMEPAAKKLLMTITAPAGAEPRPLDLKVYGKARQDNKTVTRYAEPVESMTQAFYYTHLLPISDFRTHVVDEQPFALVAELPAEGLAIARGATLPLKVKVIRKEGFTEPVTLTLRTADRSVTAEAVVVEPDKNEGTLILTATGRGQQVVPVLVVGMGRTNIQRVAGQNRQAFTASVTVMAPAFTVTQQVPQANWNQLNRQRQQQNK